MVVSLVYLFSASGTLFGHDGSIRFLVTRNLLESGRFDIQTGALAPPGRDGKPYAQYAIGHTLWMAPLDLLGRQMGRWVPRFREEITESAVSCVNLLFTVLTVGLLVLFARDLGFDLWTSTALGLVYAFGTGAWQQAKDSFEHPQIAFFFTALFYCLHRFSIQPRIRYLWGAGLALGLALLTRYMAILAGASLLVFLLGVSRRSSGGIRAVLLWMIPVSVALFPFVGFDLWFNAVRFGSPWETGYQWFFRGPLYSGKAFQISDIPSGLWNLTFGWNYGLFLFNPVFLLSFAGTPALVREHRDLWLSFLLLLGLYLCCLSSAHRFVQSGGWAWGGRYLTDLFPVGILALGPIFQNITRQKRKSLFRASVTVLIALSVFVQVVSVLVNYNRSFTKKALGIDGHSFVATGFRESPLYMQIENISEVAHHTLCTTTPLEKHATQIKNRAQMDRSMTFGSFQIWWVYALYLGIPKGWILLYLVASVLGLGWATRGLLLSVRGRPRTAP